MLNAKSTAPCSNLNSKVTFFPTNAANGPPPPIYNAAASSIFGSVVIDDQDTAASVKLPRRALQVSVERPGWPTTPTATAPCRASAEINSCPAGPTTTSLVTIDVTQVRLACSAVLVAVIPNHQSLWNVAKLSPAALLPIKGPFSCNVYVCSIMTIYDCRHVNKPCTHARLYTLALCSEQSQCTLRSITLIYRHKWKVVGCACTSFTSLSSSTSVDCMCLGLH